LSVLLSFGCEARGARGPKPKSIGTYL